MEELSDSTELLQVWMDPIEYSQVICLFEAVRPTEVVEWGAGGSTRALLQRGDFVERWISIEHHEGWAERVRAQITDPRFEILHVACSEEEPAPADGDQRRHEALLAWRKEVERNPLAFTDYIAAARTAGARPQFILVDGRARNACAREGFELLAPGGVLVLHDAQRSEYREAMEQLGAVFLEPWNQGQVAFVRKPDEVG